MDFNYAMNKQKIVIPSGIGLAAVPQVERQSLFVTLCYSPSLPLSLYSL